MHIPKMSICYLGISITYPPNRDWFLDISLLMGYILFATNMKNWFLVYSSNVHFRHIFGEAADPKFSGQQPKPRSYFYRQRLFLFRTNSTLLVSVQTLLWWFSPWLYSPFGRKGIIESLTIIIFQKMTYVAVSKVLIEFVI